jgi:hypothetical protein
MYEPCLDLTQGRLRIPTGESPEAQTQQEQRWVYWTMVRDRVALGDEDLPNESIIQRQAFCSTCCANQTWNEYDRNVCCATFDELDASTEAARTRRPPNSTKLYCAAVERNARIAKRMRAAQREREREREGLRHWPAEFDVASERKQWIRVLNVDTALLFAASTLSPLPASRRSKKAVPGSNDWRSMGAVWASAVDRVNRIRMSKEGSSGSNTPSPATNAYSPPSWFSSIKDRALFIF